jgi:catalase
MVLNRNPDNYFAEVEQAAFSPSHLVPGIEASTDRMLQGRLFSYPDTHRHRLGTNYQQIPINVAYNARISNQQRDGFMAINGNGGSAPNYEPNSFGGAKQTAIANTYSTFDINAIAARHIITLSDEDFVQPGDLYRLLSAEEKSDLIDNMAGHLKNAKPFLQERQVGHIKRADKEWGARLEAKLKTLQSKA